MGNGSKTSRIMVIGEAPGANEDKQGEPFVGKAGEELNAALAQAGVPRPAVYVTNIYKHRPPNNRPPTLEEMVEHAPLLKEEFDEVRPRHVLLVGNTSLRFFTGFKDIGSRHGTRVFPNNDALVEPDWEDIFFYCTYHPAATFYNKSTKKDFYADVKSFCDIARR